MKNQKPTPEERDAKILKLVRQGLGSNAIAERMGLSKTVVNERIYALRQHHKDVPTAEVFRLRGNFN